MLKIYKINGLTYQFEEGAQPAEAVEVKAAESPQPQKVVEPKNKQRRTVKK